MVNRDRMAEQLILHEGVELKPYLDTEGFWTIGVGYNLSARGVVFLEKVLGRYFPLNRDVENPFALVRLTRAEAIKVLHADIERVEGVVRKLLPKYDSLNEVRQRVCVDMAFNMGMRALNFRKAIDALNREDWSRAARELYASKWARQVDDGEGGRFGRADRLAHMMLTGLDYTR